MLQLIRILLENFTSGDLEYLVVEAPKLTKSLDFTLLDSLTLSKQGSSLNPWGVILDDTFRYRNPWPNNPYLYRNGNIIVPLGVIADVETTVNGILSGNLDLDRFLADDAVVYEGGHRYLTAYYDRVGVSNYMYDRHIAARGDYYNMVREFRSVVLRVVEERRNSGM